MVAVFPNTRNQAGQINPEIYNKVLTVREKVRSGMPKAIRGVQRGRFQTRKDGKDFGARKETGN